MQREDHTNKTHLQEKTTYKTVTAAKRTQWQCSRNEIQQQNNDVPGSTEDKWTVQWSPH
jgi:hypothetical protein